MELKYDPIQPLSLRISLLMGQAFRWQQDEEWFSGVLRENFIKIRQVSAGLLDFYCSPGPEDMVENMLRHYLRLDDNIQELYRDISGKDPKLRELVRKHSGLRILRQEPWECLVPIAVPLQTVSQGYLD